MIHLLGTDERVNPNFTPKALRKITINITREGLQTGGYKEGFVCHNFTDRTPLMIFSIQNGQSISQTVAASAIDGSKAIILYDFGAMPYATIRAININADIELNLDLNDGSGGGVAGDPASVAAMVRVDKLPAVRELVAIEKTTTGEWRMAGNQNLQLGELEMQVTGGQVFAVGLDDYGIPYQADLAVTEGQRIRPSNMQGWLYLITQAGQLPAQEPSWWPAQGENPPRELGTARAQAVRYYRPQALGPIKYELK